MGLAILSLRSPHTIDKTPRFVQTAKKHFRHMGGACGILLLLACSLLFGGSAGRVVCYFNPIFPLCLSTLSSYPLSSYRLSSYPLSSYRLSSYPLSSYRLSS